jgi:RND family efflux transporter MFP subunit
MAVFNDLVFDCDNHYYEAPDAFTRHVPAEMRRRCVQWAEIDGRKHHLVAGKLSEARAKLAVRQAELALARQAHARLERLRKSAAFNQARFDDARQEVAIAKAETREAETAIASAEAEQQLARINLYNARIRAPYPGVVTERLTEAGAYVKLGDPVIRMIGDQTLEVEAEVPFQYLGGLGIGTEIAISLDDGTKHRARVRAVVPAENPLTRTRTVRLVPSFGKVLRPLAHQQSVNLRVPIGANRLVLSVHKDAVVRRRGETLVFVVEGANAQPRSVELGVAVGGRFEVRAGLKEGDRVVVRGNERLKPGDKVRVTGES